MSLWPLGSVVMVTLCLLSGCGTGFTQTFQSSESNSHTHEITLLCDDLASPSESGITATTNEVLDHTHTLTLSKAEIEGVSSDNPQSFTSSTNNSHSHTFSINRC